MLFFGGAIGLTVAGMAPLAERVWALFTGANGALFLILNSDGRRADASAGTTGAARTDRESPDQPK